MHSLALKTRVSSRATRSKEKTSHAGQMGRSPVWSCNEWDPLEEVVVGVVDGATVPCWDAMLEATAPSHASWFFKKYGGKPFPSKMIEKASKELDGVVELFKEL